VQTPVLVVALDAANHVDRGYTGTVKITSSDMGATLPGNFTFQASNHGAHIFQVTFATTGSQTVTATDTSTATLTGSATLNVNPPDVATHFLVIAPPQTQAGVLTPVDVIALDAANHVVQGYGGTVKITSSDTGATLPANYTFQGSDHGSHVFQVTFANTGSQTVTATDTSTASITGSATFTVNPPAVATHFLVLAPRHAPVGVAVSVLVVALDASNRPVLGYTGTVHFTSSDTGATLPADYPFLASDYGTHLFQVTFTNTGSQTLTVTDKANASLTGSATVNVVAANGSPFGGGDDPFGN
jgi:hypothetical protein